MDDGEATENKQKGRWRRFIEWYWEVLPSDRLERFALSAWYALVVTLSLAALGVIASLHPDEIPSSFGNTVFRGDDPFSVWGTAFWGLVMLSTILFWGQRRAQNRADTRDRKKRRDLLGKQEQAVRDLREEFRSMPPSGFLNLYKETLRTIRDALMTSTRLPEEIDFTIRQEAIQQFIQIALGGLIDLCRRYDGQNEDRYAANVMLYIPSNHIPPDQVSTVAERLHHVTRETSISKLRGILDFRHDLSLSSYPSQTDASDVDSDTSESGNGEVGTTRDFLYTTDQNHPPVAFGVVRDDQEHFVGPSGREVRWRIGPGAPHALLERKPTFFADVQEIQKWMEERSTLGLDVQRRTLNYIEKSGQPEIGSFLSLPLPHTSGRRSIPFLDHPLPIGVLNIHRRGENILSGNQKSLEQFDATVMAINQLIADGLEELARLENDEFERWTHFCEPDDG